MAKKDHHPRHGIPHPREMEEEWLEKQGWFTRILYVAGPPILFGIVVGLFLSSQQ